MKNQPKTKAKLHPDEYLLTDGDTGYSCPKQDVFVKKMLEKRDPSLLLTKPKKRKK